MIGRGDRIVATVTSWPGISTKTGRFGETEFYVKGRMLGHVHGDHQADIPFPRPIRDELVAARRTGPHHLYPDSGWTTLYLKSDADADTTVDLLRLNYDRVTTRRPASG